MFVEKSELFSSINGIVHGFCGRSGGVSAPPFSSLNCSYKVGDDPHRVSFNRKSLLKKLGLSSFLLFVPNLCHGTDSVVVTKKHSADSLDKIYADALICSQRGLVLGVTYADCLPVMLSSRDGAVIAIIHAGWRGLINQIIPKTIDRMAKEYGPLHLFAAIGPHISRKSFFVKGEVFSHFFETYPQFVQKSVDGGYVDLENIARIQLFKKSIKAVDRVGGYTDRNMQNYFSHRRDGVTGRHLAIIAKI